MLESISIPFRCINTEDSTTYYFFDYMDEGIKYEMENMSFVMTRSERDNCVVRVDDLPQVNHL